MDTNYNYSDDENEEEDINKYIEINEVENDIRIEGLNDQDFNKEIEEVDESKLDYLKSNKSWYDLDLNNEFIEKLMSKGFKKPSKIQSTVIGFFSKNINKDLIVQSQNGSGKTLSFLIPSIENVLKSQNPNKQPNLLAPEVIILADTKELTYQIFRILLNIKIKNIRIDLQHPENKENRTDSNIIVCTLGRLFFLINKKILSTQNLNLFIIDEADKLLDSDSNRNKLPVIFRNLNNYTKIGIFSATMANSCIHFLEKLKRNLVKIILKDKQELSLNNISHFFIKSNKLDKFELINKLLFMLVDGSVIIFVNTKKFAEYFALTLNKKGHKVDILLGNMESNTRLKILSDFKIGKIRILVSTNLLSRGIDNRKVGLVINLDMPLLHTQNKNRILDVDTYIHRVGRTGRFGDSGIALNIIQENDTNINNQLLKLKDEFSIDMKEIYEDNLEDLKSKIEKNSNYNEKKRRLLEENI